MTYWLPDDPFVLNALILIAASSLAVALTSCLWHHIYRNNTTPYICTPSQKLSASLAPEQTDRKSTRSKERRRRGKDPFRDLFKGGKKSKALLKAINHDHSPPSADTLSNPSVHSASSSSRSHSPEPAWDADNCKSRPGVESDDGSSVKDTIPNGDPSTVEDLADHSTSSGVCPHADCISSHSCSPDSMTATDTHANVSSASTVIGHPELAPSSPPDPASRVTRSRDFETASTSAADKPGHTRTRLQVSKIDPSVQSSPCTVDSVEISFPSIYPVPTLSIAASTNLSAGGPGPSSTPTISRESTPPPQTPSDLSYDTQHLHQGVAAAETELASMRDALEAARLREEKFRVEAEQANKERDELCWRWNENAGVWRRREAELQAQIHHLMQQVQAYAVAASFPSSGFPSPTSPHAHASPTLPHPVPFPLPPAMQVQNSASPPAHVQALLTCAPMSHALGFAGPGFPGTGHGMSPLLWSGMGLLSNRDARRTPDSARSGTRGRPQHRADKSASDESSLDGVDGSDEDVWEEEEAEFRNNALADAILKRPESIRDLSVRKRTGGRGNPPASPLASAVVL